MPCDDRPDIELILLASRVMNFAHAQQKIEWLLAEATFRMTAHTVKM